MTSNICEMGVFIYTIFDINDLIHDEPMWSSNTEQKKSCNNEIQVKGAYKMFSFIGIIVTVIFWEQLVDSKELFTTKLYHIFLWAMFFTWCASWFGIICRELHASGFTFFFSVRGRSANLHSLTICSTVLQLGIWRLISFRRVIFHLCVNLYYVGRRMMN